MPLIVGNTNCLVGRRKKNVLISWRCNQKFVSRGMTWCLEFTLKYSRKQKETKCVQVSGGKTADEINSTKCWKRLKLGGMYVQFIKLFSHFVCVWKFPQKHVFDYCRDQLNNHVASLPTLHISPFDSSPKLLLCSLFLIIHRFRWPHIAYQIKQKLI